MNVFRYCTGAAMRLYRRTPLYPRLGRALGRPLAVLTRFRRNPIVRQTVHGVVYELDLREEFDTSLYYAGEFEPATERLIRSLVRPGMITIDIGANIGIHTFGLAQLVGDSGTVVAIEPTSYAFAKLQRNVSLNSFRNIRLRNVGLAERDAGEVNIAFQSSYRLDGRHEIRTEKTALVTLDTLVREEGLSRVDFIKMDTDGYEPKVFRGAHDTLTRLRPLVLFEIFPEGLAGNGEDGLRIGDQLGALGYTIETEAGEPIPDWAAFFQRLPRLALSVNVLARPA